jgi:hypothetical protein
VTPIIVKLIALDPWLMTRSVRRGTSALMMLAVMSISIMLLLTSAYVYTPQAFAAKKTSSSYDGKEAGTKYVGTYNYRSGHPHNEDNKHTNYGDRLVIYHDTSYVKGINIDDVDRSSPHLLKVTLTNNYNNNGKIPNYISIVAIGNEDKHTAGSTLISSHFTDQKIVTVSLLKKNGKHAHIDDSNDVTVVVVPTKVSSSVLHH